MNIDEFTYLQTFNDIVNDNFFLKYSNFEKFFAGEKIEIAKKYC